MWRLLSLSTCASGAQERAAWYILYTAVWPVMGSTFSGSFLAAVLAVGVSEHAESSAKRAMAGSRTVFRISVCGHSNRGLRAALLFTCGSQIWWDNEASSCGRQLWPGRFGCEVLRWQPRPRC